MDEIEFSKMHKLASEFTKSIDDVDTRTALLSVLSMVSDLDARVQELQAEPDDELDE
jgi:hypothetical protein